jgi:hypothetical protein
MNNKDPKKYIKMGRAYGLTKTKELLLNVSLDMLAGEFGVDMDIFSEVLFRRLSKEYAEDIADELSADGIAAAVSATREELTRWCENRQGNKCTS